LKRNGNGSSKSEYTSRPDGLPVVDGQDVLEARSRCRASTMRWPVEARIDGAFTALASAMCKR
jgi:hypothetical protein